MFAFTLGPSQIAILLLLGVVLFGNRLPEIGRSLAKAIREFQKGLNGIEDQISAAVMPHAPALAAPPRVSTGLPRCDVTDNAKPSA
jgi:sec-independent protein translocase protein TatA